jgi:hypothetical protein
LNSKGVAEPDELGDRNIVLNEPKVLDVFVFESDKCGLAGCYFAVIG